MGEIETYEEGKPKSWEPKKYENRLIAWVDILGWKHIVKNQQIHEVLKLISKTHEKVSKASFFQTMISYSQKQANQTTSNKEEEYNAAVLKQDRQISLFSDSIIISYSIEKEYIQWSFTELIETINYLQNELINRGYLIRGAITIGELFHKKEICFGQGLVRAIVLEATSAKYPRVIIDNNTSNRELFKKWIDAEKRIELFNDMFYGVSHFSPLRDMKETIMKLPENSITRMTITYDFKKYYDIITKGLASSKASVFCKSEWLAKQYINTYNDYSRLGSVEVLPILRGALKLTYKKGLCMYWKILVFRIKDGLKNWYIKKEYL